MSTISDYYYFSELAFAAYADLSKGMSDDEYVKALKRADDGMSQIQAEEFIKNYTVIDQYNDPSSGLSVTLFKDSSGHQTVAIRGTNPSFWIFIPMS